MRPFRRPRTFPGLLYIRICRFRIVLLVCCRDLSPQFDIRCRMSETRMKLGGEWCGSTMLRRSHDARMGGS